MTVRIRTGLIGKKLGMTNVFTDDGDTLAVTLLELSDNYVYKNKGIKDGLSNVVLAYDELPQRKVSKNSIKLETEDGVKYFKHLKEFRVNSDELPEVGKKLAAKHFRAGQIVDITGTSIGKGFAGAMKRHNFAGLEATHGISVSHRSHGSTGQCQDPGRVFKGKKMAGHLGAERVTTQNLEIVKIDDELNVVAVYGAVPGAKNSVVFINDAIKSFTPEDLPFPAGYANSNESAPVEGEVSEEQEADKNKEEA